MTCNDIPIELIAQIALSDFQLWARCLFVFRGLRAEIWRNAAFDKFVTVEKVKWYGTETRRAGLLHSINDLPSQIDNSVMRFARTPGKSSIYAIGYYSYPGAEVPVEPNWHLLEYGEPTVGELNDVAAHFAFLYDHIYKFENGGEWDCTLRWHINGVEARRGNKPTAVRYTGCRHTTHFTVHICSSIARIKIKSYYEGGRVKYKYRSSTLARRMEVHSDGPLDYHAARFRHRCKNGRPA